MLSTLAQAQSQPAADSTSAVATGVWAQAHEAFGTVVDIFALGAPLAQPGELITHLQKLGQLWALAFVILGLICLLNGYKFHKIVTVALLVVLGAVIGYQMGEQFEAPRFVVAGCLAVMLAVLAFPLMKYAVAVLGGLSGAFIGANLWAGLGQGLDKAAAKRTAAAEADGGTAAGDILVKIADTMPADAYWVGALMGLIVCGIAAFLLSKITIHLFTSLSGSTLAVFGVIALLLSFDTIRQTVAHELGRSPIVIPLLVFIPAAIGFMLQEKNSGAWGGNGQAAAS